MLKIVSRWLDSLRFKISASLTAYIILAVFLSKKLGDFSNKPVEFDRIDAVIIIGLVFFPLFVFFAKSLTWWRDDNE